MTQWMICFVIWAFHAKGSAHFSFSPRLKKLHKQHKDIPALLRVLDMLAGAEYIPSHYKDHALKGKWKGHRELHIESDWLLIYKIADDMVYLDRTGSHAELFSL